MKNKNEEIEYKFLVDKLPCNYDYKLQIIQKYLQLDEVIEFSKSKFNNIDMSKIEIARLRITISDTINYYFTLKSKGLFRRKEFECEIKKDEAEQLLKLKSKGIIIKTRYIITINNIKFEFDKYKNKDLITCEVEINDINNKQVYEKITNILQNNLKLKIKDITYESKYKNNNIAKEQNNE